MEITTKRLILRPWEESDAESLYEYAKDPEVGPIAGWPAHKSVVESLEVIREVFSGKECYAVCLKEDNIAIGCAELLLNGHTELTDKDDECELGYWIGQKFWGQGYIPEASRELIRRGFEDLNMSIIWCGHYEANEKSRRVQEKLGFVHHHDRIDVYVPLIDETRTEIINYMTREQWAEENGKTL